MTFKKGMPRFKKAGGKFTAASDGDWYKAGDGKMYPMPDEDHEEKETPEKERAEEEEAGEDKEKSQVTADDFQKSLDRLEAITKASDSESRKEELLSKAQAGGELSVEERDELFKALGGKDGVVEEPEIVKSIDAAMAPSASEGLEKALDVSEYLEAQHTALTSSLTELAKAIDASDQRQHEFNLVFAKAFHQVGELVKGMSERLGVIEKQPARQPKSRGIAPAGNVIEKGFGGGDAPTGQLSKGEILDHLEGMMQKSIDSGGSGMAACGEDLLHATAKYEQTNQISKALLGEVMEFSRARAN